MYMSDSENRRINRRTYLATALLPLASCLSTEPDMVRIEEIKIINRRTEDVLVYLVIEKGGEKVREGEYNFHARNDSNIDTKTISEPWLRTDENLNISAETGSSDSVAISSAEISKQNGNNYTKLTLSINTDNLLFFRSTRECRH